MTHIFNHGWIKKAGLMLLAAMLLMGYDSAMAQTTTVLSSNANVSGILSPQGALRYQRGFYLIPAAEMNASGLDSGMNINSIGFTIARAQSDTTRGNFKVYLQNTTDLTSRYDTGWTTVTSTTNSYRVIGLVPGAYEWQVQANCGTNSPFTNSLDFSNNNLSGCNNPNYLQTAYTGTDSVVLTWESSTSPGFTTYQVEYKRLDSVNWITANTTDTFYRIRGLASNKQYQWRVKTVCGSKTSLLNSSSFFTASINTCASLSGLATSVALADVTFSWTADTASYYDLRIRRFGTTAWSSVISVSNSITVPLTAGTTYEWQVRSICSGGATGAYATTTNVTTVGTAVCYAPIDAVTRQITDSSALFSWKPVSGATTYTIRYRLKRSISWANAISPMTKASDSLITVPATTGAYNIPFHGGSAFNYTGRGVYVAWEYSRPTGALSTANLALTTDRGTSILGVNGQDSVSLLLSMISEADSSLTSMPAVLVETSQRPETRFGSTGMKDSAAVIALYALGHHTPRFQSPTPISALIANFSATTKSYNVTLTVKEKTSGTVRYTNTQNVSVTGMDTLLVSFNGWSPTVFEQDSIIVSIPAQTNENVVVNNRRTYLQNVNASILAYDDGTAIVSAAGFDTTAGLLLNRHIVTGCAQVIAAKIFLTESAKSHPLKAIIRSKTGSIVAESLLFTATEDDINKYHSFIFTTPASFTNDTFYIGLAQTASATGYNPVGAQWEGDETRTGAYFRANADGSNLIDYPQGGRLMIKAEIISSAPEVAISGNLTLCSGATTTLTAVSVNTRFANVVKNSSSQYANDDYSASQVLSSPNVYPATGVNPNAWMSATTDGQREYLVLGFANPGKINFIDIYETANAGAVDSVFVKNPGTSNYVLVYSATAAPASATARKNHITFTETTFDVSEIRIAINSVAVPGYNAIDAVGIGTEANPGTFSTYAWTGGGTGQTKIVNAAGTYVLTVTNSSGCISKDSVTVVAAITTPPVITASGSMAICAGDSVMLTSNIATNITWSNGATTPSIWVKNAGSYSVTYNGGNCGSLVSNTVSVTINALPTATITGLLEICLGNQNQLDAGSGFSHYLWSTGDTTQTISISSDGNYSVTVTNASGCKATASVTAVYAVLASPVITGTLSFCPGGSTTLDAGATYASYQWSNGDTTKIITVTTPGTYELVVTNAGGCSASSSVDVIRFAAPVPVVNGVAGFCAAGSTTLTVGGTYASYLWTGGGTNQSNNYNSAGNKTVTVKDSNGCMGSTAFTVEAFPNPTPVISGTLSFCGGANTTLNAGAGYLSYLWSTGATTQTIKATTPGTVSVQVVNTNGCTASASATTTLTGAIPAVPGVITGAGTASCSTTGNIYSIDAVPNSSHYVWTVPAGVTIASGQGTTSVTLTFAANFQGGFISVAASNACGQSPSILPSRKFIQTLTNVPGSITGQMVGVCAPSSKTYSIAAVTGATSYTWSVPAGATIASGQNTNSITVSFAQGFTDGNICVTANNVCGSSLASCAVVTGVPPTPGVITGYQVVCSGAQNIGYSIQPVPGATSYEWTVPQSSSVAFGQGTTNVVINFGPTAGYISVIAKSACGSSEARTLGVMLTSCSNSGLVSNTINLPELRPVPEIISAYGGYSRSRKLYVEYTMGEPRIETIDKNTLMFTEGFHQPLVYVLNVKPKDSSVLVTTDLKVIAYPNPVTSVLRVKIETAVTRGLVLQLNDANGRLLQRRNVQSDQGVVEFRMEHYSGGTYYLVVTGMDGKILNTIKLVKAL